MMLTEEEAKTKWCPHTRLGTSGSPGFSFNRECGRGDLIQPQAKCIASSCMAWRWGRFTGPNNYFADRKCDLAPDPTHGYCGLAGKVEGIP